jgi:hypothetical protein
VQQRRGAVVITRFYPIGPFPCFMLFLAGLNKNFCKTNRIENQSQPTWMFLDYYY